jgi:hypothetical protein
VAFDPTEYTVVEVLAYVDEHPEEMADVYTQELAGKNRSTLMLQLEQRLSQIPAEQADDPQPILPEPPELPPTLPPEAVTPPSGQVTPPSLGSQELLEEMPGGDEPTPRLGISVTVEDMSAIAEVVGLTETGELDWGDGVTIEVTPQEPRGGHTYDTSDVYFVVVRMAGQSAACTAAIGGVDNPLLPTNGEDYHGMVRGTEDPNAFLTAQQEALRR